MMKGHVIQKRTGEIRYRIYTASSPFLQWVTGCSGEKVIYAPFHPARGN